MLGLFPCCYCLKSMNNFARTKGSYSLCCRAVVKSTLTLHMEGRSGQFPFVSWHIYNNTGKLWAHATLFRGPRALFLPHLWCCTSFNVRPSSKYGGIPTMAHPRCIPEFALLQAYKLFMEKIVRYHHNSDMAADHKMVIASYKTGFWLHCHSQWSVARRYCTATAPLFHPTAWHALWMFHHLGRFTANLCGRFTDYNCQYFFGRFL